MDKSSAYFLLAEDKLLFQHINAGDEQSAKKLLETFPKGPATFAGKCYLRDWSGEPDEIPDGELRCVWLGWKLYDSAKYYEAASQFIKSMEAGNSWLSWSSLGLGKVLSDLGRWRESRDWLLASLRLAREQNDNYRLAQGYGSIGEVFFRTGNYQIAMEMFSLDKRILPPGSSFRYRLENYVAITSGRMGAMEIAMPALWQSYFGAITSDPLSSWYSLASLFTLSVQQGDTNLYNRLTNCPKPFDSPGNEMPKAFIQVANAYWSLKKGEPDQVGKYLGIAVSLFGNLYPVESFWVHALINRFVSKTVFNSTPTPWRDHEFEIQAVPRSPGLVDRRLVGYPIQNQTFYQFADMTTCEDPFEKWKYFLI